MDQSANRFLVGAALALLLGCTNLSAQHSAPPPTVAEAHAFLADTFRHHAIGYVVWHGGRMSDNRRGRAGYYGGRDCGSEIGTFGAGTAATSTRAFGVDWSQVSSVEMSGVEAIYVRGDLVRASQSEYDRREANFHLYFPDARVSRSVLNAFELLRQSCLRRSRFD